MDSSHILKSTSQISQKDQYDTFHHARKYPPKSSRKTPSFSSSSSLSSSSSSPYNPSELECSPLSPATPLPFSGVPFSWEYSPGIPKKQLSKKKTQQHPPSSTSIKLLPLPPTTNKRNMFSSKTNPVQRLLESDHDPFLAALVECSKDDDREVLENANLWNIASGSPKVSRSLGDRVGFINLYAISCKKTCAVAESIRHLPKSTRSSNCDPIKYRSP